VTDEPRSGGAFSQHADDQPGSDDQTWEAESARWGELIALIEACPPEDRVRPGYFREGWSVKDLLAHIGTWLAEAGVALERIRAGTYRRDEIDIDELNRSFLMAMADLPFEIVRIQASSARTMLRREYFTLPPEPSGAAAWWVWKAGPEHYGEHLPRLREWVAELQRS
jgi:hypothetical protein